MGHVLHFSFYGERYRTVIAEAGFLTSLAADEKVLGSSVSIALHRPWNSSGSSQYAHTFLSNYPFLVTLSDPRTILPFS